MDFLRRWLLLGGALVLSGSQLFASGTREERAYAAAAAPFQAELWGRAATNLVRFINQYPDSARAPEAVLLLAQAEFRLGNFTNARLTLSDTNHMVRAQAAGLADEYVRWIGEAQFAAGDAADAAETWVSLTRDYPKSPWCLTATVSAAAACAQLGDWRQQDALLEDTNGVFQRAVQRDSGNPLVLSGQLARENSKYQQGDFPGALRVYSWLTNQWSSLSQVQQCQATYLGHLASLESGDFAGALAAATNLVQAARSPPNPYWLAAGWAAQGAALKSLGRTNDVLLAYQQNLSPGTPAKNQRQAILEIAALAVAAGDWTNAAAMLDQFFRQFPAAAEAELALLTLGELQLQAGAGPPADTNQLMAAQTHFSQFLGTFMNSPLAGKAYLDRGWCEWLAGNTNASLPDFREAAARLSPSEDLAVAKFKTGDAQFALGDFSGATNNYQAVLDDFENFPGVEAALGGRALYQILRADLNLEDEAGAAAAMRKLLEQFPTSGWAEHGPLLMGEAFSDFGRPAQAREVFRQFAEKYPGSTLRPQVELAVARTYEREQNWPAATTNFQVWIQNHPTNDLLPQVQYALGRASYQAGQETNALAAFTALVARYPADTNAPLAQWWVADHFFRLGGTNLLAAEQDYELIFQTPAWKNSALYYPAQLMAGRAAAGRQDFQDAANYLVKLLADTNCPPPLPTQAKFVYGGVLMRWDSTDTNRPFANFELATNVFTQICLDNPTNELGALAGSELGDCYLQLGALDAAINAYTQVASSPFAGIGLRSRAQVGLGRALEKKAEAAPPDMRPALVAQALNNYLSVFESSYGAALRDGESADAFWVKKAGWQALPLLSADNCPTNFFIQMESLLPPLKEALEKKKAALKF